MNNAIKIALCCTFVMTFGILGIIIFRWHYVPMETITGCYLQDNVDPHDRICIYADGTYEQFSKDTVGGFKRYNSGRWKSYSSSLGGEAMIGVTLSDYFDLFENRNEVDIFPYRKMVNQVYFIAGLSDNQRYYFKAR